MDVSFSTKPQTLISSVSLLSSSSFHFSTSIRREFFGCGAQLRPPGLRSRRNGKKLRLRIQSPRCLFQDSVGENSVFLVLAAAVATFALLQLIRLNYSRKRRGSPELSDEERSNAIVKGYLHKQGVDTMKQEVVGSEFLGCESLCTPEKVHASETKGRELRKLQLVVLDHEKDKKNEVQHGNELIASIPTDNALVETTGAEGPTSSSAKVNEVGAMEQSKFAAKMPYLLPGEQVETEALPTISFVEGESTYRRSGIDFERNKSKTNQQKHEVGRIKSEYGEVLASSGNAHIREFAEEVSECTEVKQLMMKSVPYINTASTEPYHLTFPDKVVSHIQVKPAVEGADVLVKRSPLSADRLNGQENVVYLKEGPVSKEKKIVKAHGFARDDGRIHENDGRKYPQQNGFVRGANDPTAYIRTYNRLLRDTRLRDCIKLLEGVEKEGLLDMDKVHHTSFLKVCKIQKAVKEAFDFCKLIRKPTMSTYNMLLSVCASSQNFDGALQVMLLVKEAGLRPDCKLYTTLISTCGKSGKVDAMFEVFHEMVNAGVEPNVNTYGALIDGCARAGQVAKAFGAYGIMRSKKVQPDRVVFNALITACGQSGAVDRAFDVLSEMRAEPKPLDPDHVTVGALMKTCIQAGQVARAHEVYKMLHLYKIKGTPDVYTIAVRSCSLTGDLEFALGIYVDMKKNGVMPDEMFLSTLIDVAGHAGKVDAAFQILQDARTKGIRLGNVSYSSLMGACCNAKNCQKALELYEDIKATKLLPTVSTLNALVTSLCDGDQLLKAVEVLDEMKEAGVQPNAVTYSVLIVACEKKNEAEMGLMLFSQAKKDRVLPNLIMYRCLTGLCLKSLEKAYSLGEAIVTFNSGKPEIDSIWTTRAIMVYRQMISAGVIPTIEVFSQVLGCLQFPHDSSLRNRFIENLGVDFDASRCSNICAFIAGFGEYDIRSFNVLEEAASLGVIPRVSFKESPIVVDARKFQVHIVEVYLLTILKGLKHRLAAGARLPNVTILLPTEKTKNKSTDKERIICVAGRIGQAVGSLLRRLGLPYQGDESYGKIRINGLTLRRWFRPKLMRPPGGSGEMIPTTTRLAKGITDQQRNIRSSNNFCLEQSSLPPR